MLKRVITLGVAAVAITSLVGFSTTVEQQKGKFNEYIPYAITGEENNSNVDVYQKINSKSDLEDYKQIVKNNNEKALTKFTNKSIPVTITFKDPLNTDEFKKFVNRTGFKVEDYKIRSIDNQSNELVTIGGRPVDGELVPQKNLNEMLKGSTFEGFIAVRGEIKLNQGNYNKLANDETVLLTDLSTELIKDEVSQEKDVTISDIDKVEDVYWYHENF